MSGIIYDARRIKAFEDLKALGEYTGKTEEYVLELWECFLEQEELLKEFMYYLDNHCFLDTYKVEGYSLTDLYVWQLDRYNLVRDMGKNTAACNKEIMVLDAFHGMRELLHNPAPYIKRMTEGNSMDYF